MNCQRVKAFCDFHIVDHCGPDCHMLLVHSGSATPSFFASRAYNATSEQPHHFLKAVGFPRSGQIQVARADTETMFKEN